MKRTWLPLFLIFLCFAFTTCNKQPTAPEPLKPGNRNYTWKLDTLYMPMNYIDSVWGAAPNDVWATGAGGTEYDRLLHYDGEKWSTYKNEPINCCGHSLYGFSANDIWMGGQAGWGYKGAGIWHYNGVEWSQNFVYYVDGAYDVQVQHLWGTAPSDVYASGVVGYHEDSIDNFRGFVLHYDGNSWKEVVRAQFDSQFLKVRKNHNRVIVQSYERGGTSSAQHVIAFYQVKPNKLIKLYETTLETIYWVSLHVINDKTYFVIGPDVYEYLATGKMAKRLSFPQPEFECQICGRTEADLFVYMKDGIAHYNGVDLQYLYKFPTARMGGFNDPMIFEKEVFFCIDNPLGSIYTRNMMLHGILTEDSI